MSLNDYEPPPSESLHPACWDIFLERPEFREIPNEVRNLLEADIRERDARGEQKYGVRLHPYNGRNSLHDLYQEQLDALIYSVKYLYEMLVEFPAGSGEVQNAYHLFARTLELVRVTRWSIFKIEGK